MPWLEEQSRFVEYRIPIRVQLHYLQPPPWPADGLVAQLQEREGLWDPTGAPKADLDGWYLC